MIKISKEKVMLLHQLIAEETGGGVGVRDEGLLDSALNNAYSTFGGEELYKTKEEKAASLCFSLISNNAFVDGNKRIGVYVMLTFLEAEGNEISFEEAKMTPVVEVPPAPVDNDNCDDTSESVVHVVKQKKVKQLALNQ